MAGGFEYFLDIMPGETRGIVARDGVCHRLLIERSTDRIEHRLGTRMVARVARVEPGIRAAFIDIGVGEPFGFLPLPKNLRLDAGAKIEVLVTNEPRESKGPMLRYIGEASGEVRILEAGPDVTSRLKALAAGEPIITGLEALRMGRQAVEEGLALGVVRSDAGLDVAVERTRALIAVDIDYAPLPGKDSRRARDQVNRLGLQEAARLLQLKSWGGIIAIDFAGVNLHIETVTTMAKQVFAMTEGAAFGPLSRFGVLQMSLPWGQRPLDERMAGPEARALEALRDLNEALLSQTAVPVWVLGCDPAWEAYLAPLVRELGPRARLAVSGTGGFSVREV